MPTALERAKMQEERRLARAGLNPDGSPMNPTQRLSAMAASRDDDDDDDDDRNDDDDDRNDDDDDGRNGNGDGRNGNGATGSDADDPAELRRQLAKLQADLAAANNRAAPEQQRAQEMRDLWQASERARIEAEQRAQQQIEALQAQLDAQRPAFDIRNVLSEEEISVFDESTLSAIVKISESIAKASVPKIDARSEALKVLEERDAAKVINYRNKVLNDPTRGLHQLSQLAHDPAFQAWSQEDDNDMESVVTSLLNAKSTEEVDRFAKIVAKRITKFKERTSPPTDTRTSLGNGMRRSGKPRMTEAEVNAKLKEATQLSRSRNPADREKAQRILNDLK